MFHDMHDFMYILYIFTGCAYCAFIGVKQEKIRNK